MIEFKDEELEEREREEASLKRRQAAVPGGDCIIHATQIPGMVDLLAGLE